MKKYSILLIAGAMAALSLGSCKTTEANYRQAYESARQKQTQEGGSAITAGLNNQARPRSMEFDGVTLPVLTTGVSIPKDGGMELSRLKKFNSVAGVFRQIFNAKSMRERLMQSGYPDAFILSNAYGTYYVLTTTTSSPAEAQAALDKLRNDPDLRLRQPLPYILRPGHLAR